MNFIGYRTLKTGISATVAMIIAQKLGLEYAASAGIIAILSIQITKKQSFKIAFQRICACVLALCISSILFNVLSYEPIVFGLFLLIFIPLSVRFNVQEGIVVSSVLVTHLLVEKSCSLFWLLNELKLMIIGVGVALIFNFYMQSIEGKLKKDLIYIEEMMKEILFKMAIAMKENCSAISEDELFNELESRLHKSKVLAYKNLNNYFRVDMSYYVQYMKMRIQQFETLKRMKDHFQRFFDTYEQTIIISDFTEKVADLLHEENTCDDMISELNMLRENFKTMPLPLTREEFENRAMLFQFLNDMDQFLQIKSEFKKNLVDED